MKPLRLKRFVKSNVRRLRLAKMLAGLAVLGLTGCKPKPKSDGVQLKGLFGDELASDKQVDYAQMFDNRGANNPIKITLMISYESVYELGTEKLREHDGAVVHPKAGKLGLGATGVAPRAGQAGINSDPNVDDGTMQAYDLMDWIEEQAKRQNDPSQKSPGASILGPIASRDNVAGLAAMPPDRRGVELGKTYGRLYRFQHALAPKRTAGEESHEVFVDLEVVLGTAGFYAQNEPQSQGFMDAMQGAFFERMARAMVLDDIVAYNGHIWAQQGPLDQLGEEPADEITKRLTDTIRSVQTGANQQPGIRRKPGVIFMNACYSEKIEGDLIDAMRPLGNDERKAWRDAHFEPILLSHNNGQFNGVPNYSNYRYFNEMDTNMLVGLFSATSLPQLILKMTPAMNYAQVVDALTPDGQPSPTDNTTAPTPDVAQERMHRYRTSLESIADFDLRREQVLIVAYDISDDKTALQRR
jgi:hypothetical protein